uniref:Uncharacterized protein n=1 Tax=Rhizophora mucronata TaxID=61149 RepID=A0A2P2PGX4_RHIMU
MHQQNLASFDLDYFVIHIHTLYALSQIHQHYFLHAHLNPLR